MLHVILGVFLLCFVVERAYPGWRLPRVHSWTKRVLLINAVQLGIVLLAGVSWERWLHGFSVFHAPRWFSPLAGGLVAYVVATFIFYWWHRWRHESDLLWRVFHQIHHSPQRLEVITSFYKHPLEMIVNSLLGSILVFSILGLSPAAGAYYTMFTALGEFFIHTSIKTPRWIGWFFQRPEMHRIHHQYGRHKNNYGDITWWDMLFGTYENPAEWTGHCGYDEDQELRLGDMLKFHDVHKASKILGSILFVLMLLASAPQANACSAFANQKRDGTFFVAKNFDWNSAEGYLVVNGRQMTRHSLSPLANIQWKARYASVSLTSLGPGFPVSGMNETGLIVEALVDKDYIGPTILRSHLSALEWAQYLLDRFATIAEVVAFASNYPFDQVAVPLHLFVCDNRQHCAVIEARGTHGQHLVVTTGSHLKTPTIANRGWVSDYENASTYVNSGGWTPLVLSSKFASFRRFANLAAGASDRNIPDNATIYSYLDSAKIWGLIQWQVIWDQTQRTVHWRVYDGSSPGRIQTHKLSTFFGDCQQGIQVQELGVDRPTTTRYYQNNDVANVEQRTKSMMNWRLGSTNDHFAKIVADHTTSAICKQ